MKKLLHLLLHRVVSIVLFMLIQLALLVGMVWRFNNYFIVFYAFSVVLSVVIVLAILNGRDNPAYKIAWIIPILVLPFFGGLLYLVFSHSGLTRQEKRRMATLQETLEKTPLPDAYEELKEASRAAAGQSLYMKRYAFCPPCRNTASEYLPLGEIAYERMLEAMRAAERYIFLEYFIVQGGVMWNTILELLIQKAAAGVDVRLIYDDMGCMFTLPYRYNRKLEEVGIKCCVFNPFKPVLSSRFNNRSHRKITSIDGKIAYTGGINLADEYINAYEKHGHWKDSAIELRGDAAWTMTVSFLGMWGYLRGVTEKIEQFRPEPTDKFSDCPGFYHPYSDSPLDGEPVGENVYMNLINRAERYVYITTPYLIVDNEMMTALCSAAKCGVDVRIITPHVADKWYVHAVTRHNYLQLVESGVRILEYTPGFMHAKSFVVDDVYSVVGTVNLDYRSLYLHFECGVWMYKTDSVAQVLEDFRGTERLSQEITLEECLAVPVYRRLGRSLLSVFSPLM